MISDNNKIVVVSAESQELIDGNVDYLLPSSSLDESVKAGGTLCKMEENGGDVEEEDTLVEVENATPCDICAQSPCDLITFGDAIYEESKVMVDKRFPPKDD